MVDAREYHERTKHSPRSVRENAHRLDRANQPRPFKVYEDLPRVAPGDPGTPTDVPALVAVAQQEAIPGTNTRDDPAIHALCHYASGVTKEVEIRGQPMRFRAAACTGKLYHVDLYAVTGECGPFDLGVYHYDPHEEAFDVLRRGDYRGLLARAAGDEDGAGREGGGQTGVAAAPVTFVATSTWWRNAWKYRERTYRHAFWDSGTILANLLAVAHATGHRAEVVAGFADGPVADLLGIDPDEEAPLELVPVGAGDRVPDAPSGDASAVSPIDPAEVPLSEHEETYPILADAWRQSSLADGNEAREWRDGVHDAGPLGTNGAREGDDAVDRVQLDPVDCETASARPIDETIERRGSLREYAREPISARKLATVLDRALRGVPVACLPDDGPDDDGGPGHGTDALVDYYCLVHAVDGVPAGAYRYRPGDTLLERVGDIDRRTAAHLALDQGVVGDAAVNVYVMADVDAIVEAVGNRGYRLAQLIGGISLGRLYLATYAHLALGGRGFTFYDDPVSEHLSPHATGQTPMTLFALGHPAD